MNRFIPLSTKEAWRLYNCGYDIVEMQSLKSRKCLIKQGKSLEYFKDKAGKTMWALVLSKQDNELLDCACQKRVRRLIGSIVCLSLGGIFLLSLSKNIPSPRFSTEELYLYGISFSFVGCFCLYKLAKSFSKTQRAWEKLFAKYDAWDYYKN